MRQSKMSFRRVGYSARPETPAGERRRRGADVEEEDGAARGRHLREAGTGPAQGDALEVHGDGLGAVDEGPERIRARARVVRKRTSGTRPGGNRGRGGVLGERRFAAELTGRARIPNPALHRHRQATGEFGGEPVGGGDIRRVGDRGTRVSLTGRGRHPRARRRCGDRAGAPLDRGRRAAERADVAESENAKSKDLTSQADDFEEIDADEIRTRAGNAHSLSRRTPGFNWRLVSRSILDRRSGRRDI